MAAFASVAPAKRNRGPRLSVGGLIGGFVEWRRNRAAAAQLRALPDHMLDDLGLTRAEIDEAAAHGRR